MTQDFTFTTKISGSNGEEHELRGVPLSTLVAEHDFITALFLSLTGRLPEPAERRILDAIMTISIDHGAGPASITTARTVASTGNDVLTAMSAVPTTLGPRHGAAIGGCMQVLTELETLNKEVQDLEQAAHRLVVQYREAGKRIPGFGHPHYRDEDPRTQQLFDLAREVGLDPLYVNSAITLEQALEQVIGRKLILNVDGAIAALLKTMGMPVQAGNALFAASRMAGSIAHIIEEQGEGQMRRVSNEEIAYKPEKK